MNATDVVGYVKDCSALCPHCAKQEGWTDGGLGEGDAPDVSVYFPTDETDSPQHCEMCGDMLPLTLTEEGQRSVAGALREWLRTHGRAGRLDVLTERAAHLENYGGARGRIARRFLERAPRYDQVAA